MVTIGSDNWYFFNGNGAILDYLGLRRITEKKLQKINYLLQDRAYWLKTMGIQYIYLPIPNKEAVYGDHLPAGIRKNKGVTVYDQLMAHLEHQGMFSDYIDTQKIMLQHKDHSDLFLRTDSHWNHDGTYLIYQEVMKRLQKKFPGIIPLKLQKEKKWVKDFSGDLAILMNLNGVITETAPDLNIVEECSPRAPERMTELKKIPEYRDIEMHRLPVKSGCSERQHKVVLIHDSFGNFLRPYFSQQFETVIFINYLNFEDAKTVIELEKPDIVIDQRVARNLLKGVKSDETLEQLVLQDKFDRLPDLRTVIDDSNWKESLFVISSDSTQEFENTIEIKFGRQPSSVTFRMDKTDRFSDPSAVKLDLVADIDNEISICYKASDGNDQQRDQCKKRVVREGGNSVFFRIIDPDKRGLLELKPLKPGRFLINSIVAKREHGDR
jgi:hypothetical protein